MCCAQRRRSAARRSARIANQPMTRMESAASPSSPNCFTCSQIPLPPRGWKTSPRNSLKRRQPSRRPKERAGVDEKRSPGRGKPGEPHPAGSRATDEKGGADMVSRWLDDDILTKVQNLQPIADEAGLSMAQLAVAWTLQNDNVSAAIIGASRPEQVTENVKAAGVTLEPALMKQIDDVLEGAIERDPVKTKSPPTRDFG